MSLNHTSRSGRVHIGFFGRRNAGKSSLVNAVTGQALSVVSAIEGTTTDPVYKAMELLPLGPVMMIDTPGFDDEGTLGALRVEKTRQVLAKTDIAVLVVDAKKGLTENEHAILSLLKERALPYLIVYNKADLLSAQPAPADNELYVSAKTGLHIQELKEKIALLAPPALSETPLIADLLAPEQLAVLVTPIDEAAPKGRIILPQQQVLRDVLDANAYAVVVKETQLKQALSGLQNSPAMVITDSQAFETVAAIVPPEVPLTSFSILMARHKGFLETAVKGAAALQALNDGDKVLIAEGCTHHRQCNDIGTVKLPGWIQAFTGKKLRFDFTSGTEFPADCSGYALVIHCGGCMLNTKEMKSRMNQTVNQGVPFTNYGIAIAHIHGILARSLSLFPKIEALL